MNKNTSLIFLDFDGVLNDHKPLKNGYCNLKRSCLRELEYILRSLPDLKIVVSSAWRYLYFNGDVNLRGLEYIMCLFGIPFDVINEKIMFTTLSDEKTCLDLGLMEKDAVLDYQWLKENGLEIREIQIEHIASVLRRPYVVVDDLPLKSKNFIQTNGLTGLTRKESNLIIKLIKQQEQNI